MADVIWARGVELLDEKTVAEMLGGATAVFEMAGSGVNGEPDLYHIWAPAGDAGAQLIVREHGSSRGGSGANDEYGLEHRVIQAGQLMVCAGRVLCLMSCVWKAWDVREVYCPTTGRHRIQPGGSQYPCSAQIAPRAHTDGGGVAHDVHLSTDREDPYIDAFSFGS
eukprot:COSAG01_NODE_995_length_12234_cov_3.196193_8_plen_166_part_00